MSTIDRKNDVSTATVAVVLVNWNKWEETTTCVASLRAGARTPDRVIVVDNGSSDSSIENLSLLINQDLELIQLSENGGFASGANIGANHAVNEVDFIWFLNNDCVVHEGCLHHLLAAARESAASAFVPLILDSSVPGELHYGGGNFNPWLARPSHITRPEKVAVAPAPTRFATGCSLLVSSATLREVGLLDERFFLYWEDIEFSQRLLATGRTIELVPGARISHAQGTSSAGSGGGLSRTYYYYNARNRLLYLRKFETGARRITALLMTVPLATRDLLRILLGGNEGAFQLARSLLAGLRDGLKGDFERRAPLEVP